MSVIAIPFFLWIETKNHHLHHQVEVMLFMWQSDLFTCNTEQHHRSYISEIDKCKIWLIINTNVNFEVKGWERQTEVWFPIFIKLYFVQVKAWNTRLITVQ